MVQNSTSTARRGAAAAPAMQNSTSYGAVEDPETPKLPHDTSSGLRRDEGRRRTLQRREASEKEFDLPWFVNPHVWWRHPFYRIVLAWLILAFDFWIYIEDPVNESHVEYVFEGFGHVYGLLFIWPASIQLKILRGSIIAGCTMFSFFIGKRLIHRKFLKGYLGISMFQGEKGSHIVGFLFLPFMFYLGSYLYNLSVSGLYSFPLTANTHTKFYQWSKVWQYLSVLLDVLTITQITDVVLQDLDVYPHWLTRVKIFWKNYYGGNVRIVAVWTIAPLVLFILYLGIHVTGHRGMTGIAWTDTALGGITCQARTMLASIIILCDLVQVSQDWEFPTFDKPADAKVCGTTQTELSIGIDCFCSCNCIPQYVLNWFSFTDDSAWLIYGPLLGSLLASFSCAKTQFTYEPARYGQYRDPQSLRVWNIVDDWYLARAYRDGALYRPEMVTWAARNDASHEWYNATSARTDIRLNTLYVEGGMWDWVVLIPVTLVVVGFFIAVSGGEQYWRSPALIDPKTSLTGGLRKCVSFFDQGTKGKAPEVEDSDGSERCDPSPA